MKIEKRGLGPNPTPVDRAAERLAQKLESTSVGAPVADLKDHLGELRDELDLRKSELVDAAVLALAQLQEPQAVIDGVVAEVAAALKATPQEIADRLKARVADGLGALATQTPVSDAAFDAAMSRPVEERRGAPSLEEGRTARPFGELRDMPAADYKKAVGKLAEEIKEKWGEQAFNAPLVEYFVKRFEEMTGVHVVRADTVAALFRDFGDAFRALFEREMPITIIAGDNAVDQLAVRDLMKGVYDELEARGLKKRVAQVGRFGGGGAQEAAFSVLEKVKDVDRIALGSASKESLSGPASVVDKGLLFGKSLGEESWLTRELARRGVAIVFGGDGQALDEAKEILEKNPSGTFVCGGFADGIDAKLTADGATFLPDARTKPIEAGRVIGARIADAIEREQRELLSDPLMQVVFKGSKGQLSDMVTALQQNAAQNRIVRIVTAVGERLERAGVPPQKIWQDVAQLSQNLARYTLGVDNFRDNALWQKRAKEAFEVTGGRIKDIVDDASVDVYFASWGGIQRKPEEPSYFEQKTSSMPSSARRDAFDYDAPHTMLDLGKYCYKRLDKPIADMLKKAVAGGADSKPEVFLGNEAELKAYYAAKGFSTSYNAFDSNGTYYMVFQRGDVVRPVLFGIDSPARLTQVTALLEQAGVDTSQFTVRGEMARVRLEARNRLEEDINVARKLRAGAGDDVGPGIAGVVINNTAEAVATIAASAGLKPEDVRISGTRTIGPFRYDVIEVKGVGRDRPDLILCFKPAYGELTQDLVNACLSVGARNFLIGGAAGSLINDEKEFGAMHRVTSIEFEGKTVDLAAAGLELMKAIPGVTQDGVTNVFHPSPVMQSQAVADEMRAHHKKANVDQETAAALFALTEAKRRRPEGEALRPGDVTIDGPVFVSSLLHQSDVVGKGYLELGTVDKNYVPNVKANVAAWLKELGVASVTTQDGRAAAVRGAKAGKLAEQRQTTHAVKIDMPDLATIGASSDYSAIDQFKGQKRCIVLDSKNPSSMDLELLKSALGQLDASQYWVVVGQEDKNHGALLELARELKLESVLLTTREAAQKDEILGTPTFTMFLDDNQAIATAKTEMSTSGTRYEWEENTAQHHRFFVGDYALDKTPGKNEHYTCRMASERDAQDAGETIRSELKQTQGLVREGLAGWATGTYVAHRDETLLQLATRFGLVDLRGGLEQKLLPHARALAKLVIGDVADTATPKELKGLLAADKLATLSSGLSVEQQQWAALARSAIVAKDSWPENIGGDDKIAAMMAAARGVAEAARKLPSSPAAAPHLLSLAAAADDVVKNGVSHKLAALNPSLPANAPLTEGAAVKLREGDPRPAPKVISSSFFRATLEGRKPLYLTGASAKSWPFLSPEDRALTLKRYQLLAKMLDPKKVSIVTGLTTFGADKFVQETFGPKGFQLVCVATENTLKDLRDTSPHATHVLLSGINWFGKSRELGKLIEDNGGDMVVDGGGAIMESEIKQALGLGVRIHLRDGIRPSEIGEGEAKRLKDAGKTVQLYASAEQASTFKAHAFSATQDLFARLGIDTSGLKPADIADSVTPELLAQVLDVNKEAAAMARYGLSPPSAGTATGAKASP